AHAGTVPERASRCQARGRVVASRAVCLRRLALLAACLLTPSAGAQPLQDLNELALGWTRGEWASPLGCGSGGEAPRGPRPLLVPGGPRDSRPPRTSSPSSRWGCRPVCIAT